MSDFNFKTRVPTNKEYVKLIDVTAGENAVMHWDSMASWVDKPKLVAKYPNYRAFRGYYSARLYVFDSADFRSVTVGFRPAFESLNNNTLPAGMEDGDVVVIGTLYMNGEPVKVPQNPMWSGDIENYLPGAKLEFGSAHEDSAYHVQAIKVGDVFICDRCLLKNISYDDIESALAEPCDRDLFDVIEEKCALVGYEVIDADSKGFLVAHPSEDRHFRIDITEMSA